MSENIMLDIIAKDGPVRIVGLRKHSDVLLGMDWKTFERTLAKLQKSGLIRIFNQRGLRFVGTTAQYENQIGFRKAMQCADNLEKRQTELKQQAIKLMDVRLTHRLTHMTIHRLRLAVLCLIENGGAHFLESLIGLCDNEGW